MLQTMIIPLLAFVSITAIGGAVIAARGQRRRLLTNRLQPLDPLAEQGGEIGDEGQTQSGGFLAALGNLIAPSGASTRLQEKLTNAGYYGRNAASIYLGVKMLLLIGGLVAMVFVIVPLEATMGMKIMSMMSVAGLLSFIPNLALEAKLRERRTQVRNHLPDAVDLLEICVSSGMGMDMAWNSVADEVRRVSPVFADEMLLTNLEIHLGASRAEAMRHMAQRTKADEVASLVAMLVQTERFGTSLSDSLRTFAETMRESRAQRAEEAAEKMAVKLLFPMILFIFPTIMLVTAGPAAITVADLFGI